MRKLGRCELLIITNLSTAFHILKTLMKLHISQVVARLVRCSLMLFHLPPAMVDALAVVVEDQFR